MWTSISKSSSSNEDENENNNKETMRKIFFALVGTVVCLLTSCFGEPGGYNRYPAYVLIDKAESSVSLIDFYEGKKYVKFENLNKPEHLATFNLQDATIALAFMHFEYDETFEKTATIVEAKKENILPITNVTPNDSLQPIISLLPLINYSNNTQLPAPAWVNSGYLTVQPAIRTTKVDKYFLMPEKVANDTLYLKLAASYSYEKGADLCDDPLFYDLRTLRDTANTDTELRAKMREALAAIEQHKRDSMCIALTGQWLHENGSIYGKDTIKTFCYFSNYFKCDF